MDKSRLSRRTFLRTAAAAGGAGFLVACGATPDTATTTTSAASAADASTAVATDASVPAPSVAVGEAGLSGQQGVLWGLKYDPHVAAYQRLADLFQQQTGATLRVEPQDGDLVAKLIAALSAGTQPDVMCLIGKALVPLFLQKALLPLDDTVYAEQGVDPKTAFIGDAIGAYTWDNRIYGVPVESNGVGHVVNIPIDDVKALGLADKYPPTNGQIYFNSYEEMWELGKALQVKEGDNVTRWGLSSKGWELLSYLGIIRSLGVTWFDRESKSFNINSDAGVQAMQLLVETPVKMGIETELDQTQVDAALAGKVALARGNGTPAAQGGPLGFNFELAGAPRVKPGEDPLFVGEGGWGFIALQNAKNPDLSTAFLRMMLTQEAQFEYAKIYDGSLNYAWAAFADDTTRFADPSPDAPLVRASKWFSAMLPQTEFIGQDYGYFGECDQAVSEVCSEVRQGNLSAADGAKQIQERFEAQYKQFVEDSKSAGT